MSGRVIAGIGLRQGCPADEIVALVQEAAGRTARAVQALAVPEFKAAETGPAEAAASLGITLLTVGRAALEAAGPRCPTRSAAALRHVGVPSVAEGAALAACGAGGRLLLARIAGPRVTCALAESAEP